MSSSTPESITQGIQIRRCLSLVGTRNLHPNGRAPELFEELTGERSHRADAEGIRWQGEGPAHHLVLGATEGFEDLAHARSAFESVGDKLGELAKAVDSRFFSAGMHPWMAASDANAWPIDMDASFHAMRRVFTGDRHALVNGQGLFVSLPFSNDEHFARLFSALRLALPLMPAMAASSPIVEARHRQSLDCRNLARSDLFSSMPVFARSLVPEAFENLAAYEAEVLEPLVSTLDVVYDESSLAPTQICGHSLVVDKQRGAIDVQALGMQECLDADLAMAAALLAVAGKLMQLETQSVEAQRGWESARLAELLAATMEEGRHAVLRDADYLTLFDYPERGAAKAAELWQFLLEEALADQAQLAEHRELLNLILRRGNLAEAMMRTLGPRWGREALHQLCQEMCNCLDENRLLGSSPASPKN